MTDFAYQRVPKWSSSIMGIAYPNNTSSIYSKLQPRQALYFLM